MMPQDFAQMPPTGPFAQPHMATAWSRYEAMRSVSDSALSSEIMAPTYHPQFHAPTPAHSSEQELIEALSVLSTALANLTESLGALKVPPEPRRGQSHRGRRRPPEPPQGRRPPRAAAGIGQIALRDRAGPRPCQTAQAPLAANTASQAARR
jgi:hypothetical protein